jgi:hypothetical protein
MSIQAMVWALERDMDDPLAKFVLTILANHANPRGECWPSLRLIMRSTSIKSRRTVHDKLTELIEIGMVEVTERHDRNGRQMANRYTIMWPGRLENEVPEGLDRGEGANAAPSPESEQAALDFGRGEGAAAARGEGANFDRGEGAAGAPPRVQLTAPPIEPSEEPKEGTKGVAHARARSAREHGAPPPDDQSDFEDFWNAYPKQPGDLQHKAHTKQLWQKLSPEHRAMCLDVVVDYGASHNMGKARGKKTPHWFLLDKVYVGLAEQKAAKAVQRAAPAPKPFFARRGTPEFAAWAKALGKPAEDTLVTGADGVPRWRMGLPWAYDPEQRAEGCWQTTRWPPGHEDVGRAAAGAELRI